MISFLGIHYRQSTDLPIYFTIGSTTFGMEVVSLFGVRLVSDFFPGIVSLITWLTCWLLLILPVPAEVALMEEITHRPAKAAKSTFFIHNKF